MLKKLKNLFELMKDGVFKRYMVTMGAVVIATVLSAVIVDFDADTDLLRDVLEVLRKLTCIAWSFALGALFTEQVISDKKNRLIGFILAGALAVIFTLIVSSDSKGLSDRFVQEIARVFVVYMVWLGVGSIFSMYKKAEKPFADYCMRAFGGVMKTTLVYGLFALGVALIIWIFNLLIFDTDEFIWRLEIILAGWIYVPGVILALSDTQKETGKFYNMVVRFVLVPLTMLAFLIIYIYIIKIIVGWNLPQNEVFSIVAWLFAFALPIWTLGSVFRRSDFMGKISNLLPYIFAPFIVLQMICMGLRIVQYGLTDERYLGCALILFEIICIVMHAVRGQAYLGYIVYVAAAMASLLILVPFVRVDDAVYYTQMTKLKSYMALSQEERESLSAQEKKRLVGAYNETKYDDRGEVYIAALPAYERDWIKNLGEEINEHVYGILDSGYAHRYGFSMDIEGYSVMYSVSGSYPAKNVLTEEDLRHYELKQNGRLDAENKVFIVDVYDYLQRFREEANGYDESQEWLEQHPEIRFEGGTKLIVSDITYEYEDDICKSLHIEGYYLK